MSRLKWLWAVGLMFAVGCSNSAPPADTKTETPKKNPAAVVEGTPPAAMPPAPTDPVKTPETPDKTVATPTTPAASAAGKFDPWFVTGDYHIAIVLQPRQLLNSELVKGLPKEAVGGGLKELEKHAEGAPVGMLEKVDLLAVLAKAPEDLAKIAETNPENANVAIYIRFAEPTTIEQVTELLPLPFQKLEKVEKDGKTYHKSPAGVSLIALDDKTYVGATGPVLDSVLAGKPVDGALRTQLVKADAASELILAFTLTGLNDKLSEVVKPLGDQGAPPMLLDLPKQIAGGCITAGVTGPSLLKVMITGASPAESEKLEGMVKQGLTSLKGLWAGVRDGQAPPEAKPLVDVADKVVESISLVHAGDALTLDVKNPPSWKEVVAALEPAIKQTQAAAKTTIRRNNLKMIGLAMHNYHDSMGELPPARGAVANFDKDGKPFLTWRAHILPYLDESTLYNMLKVTEAADSEANKAAMEKSPTVYLSSPTAENTGKTRIVRFSGPDTLFDKKKVNFADIKDGSSNTIMAIELPEGKEIPWTSIDDIVFDPAKPLEAIGKIPPEGLLVLMCDGSVKTLKADIPADVFKALITPAGGETIDDAAAFKF